MGGGNGQKSKMAREKNMEKQKNAARGLFSLPTFNSLGLGLWSDFLCEICGSFSIYMT